MQEKADGRRTVRRRVVTGTNPEGTKKWGWRTFDADEPPTLDELPVDGQLSESPPPTVAGKTPADLERSRRSSRVISGTERGLPRGDRD